MAYKKVVNVAQYKGANWSNFKKRVAGCTPARARRIATCDPSITFFFYCRWPVDLGDKGKFDLGDAVFFTGRPEYGDAPQCDAYEKDFLTIGYFDSRAIPFRNLGRYLLADGRPFFDIACLFAANIKGKADNAKLSIDGYIETTLKTSDVKTLQDQGIAVLLSVLGDHEPAGWAAFPNEVAATNFAEQLACCVSCYGLDGIDIDDEYSCYIGSPEKCPDPSKINNDSLIMATRALRTLMPDIIISKALYSDLDYFRATWDNKTLAQQLSYGWEMSYGGGGPDPRLKRYNELDAQHRLQKNQLSLGIYWHDTRDDDIKPEVDQVKRQGYGGIMINGLQDPEGRESVAAVAQVLYGKDLALYLPSGSYLDSTANVKVTLSADCQPKGGHRISSLDITAALATDILNDKGTLKQSGQKLTPGEIDCYEVIKKDLKLGDFVPNGIYLESTTDIKVTLSGDCLRRDGQVVPSTLDISQASLGDICVENENGVLVLRNVKA